MSDAPVPLRPPADAAWHQRPVAEALAQFGAAAAGLSGATAAQRLATDGPNELKESERTTAGQIFLGQFKSLITWILVGAGVISALLATRSTPGRSSRSSC